ncbi:GntR family transcriptional regulator [Sessilibacter sp. MAH2]
MSESENATTENTLASNITRTLRDAIVCGDLAPGSKLSEPKLSKEYNISRGPLREAMRRLESMKLVKYVPHGGARVITLDLPQVIEIYHIREALEGKAAALAAKNITDEGIENLKRLLKIAEEHMAATGGAYIQADADIDFHYRVIQASNNQMLIHTLCEELYYLVRMYRYKSSLQPSRSLQAFKEHQHLVLALEQRDEQLAELIMRKHIVRARENIEQQLLNS